MLNPSNNKPTNSPINALLWVAVISALLLLIPAIAMQFTTEVNWQINDFIVMGLLLFSVGSAAVLLWRTLKPGYRIPAVLILSVLFIYIWAELAVGLLFDFGS